MFRGVVYQRIFITWQRVAGIPDVHDHDKGREVSVKNFVESYAHLKKMNYLKFIQFFEILMKINLNFVSRLRHALHGDNREDYLHHQMCSNSEP